MELLHLPNAKLLYTIAVLHKDKAITSEENLYLKGTLPRSFLYRSRNQRER